MNGNCGGTCMRCRQSRGWPPTVYCCKSSDLLNRQESLQVGERGSHVLRGTIALGAVAINGGDQVFVDVHESLNEFGIAPAGVAFLLQHLERLIGIVSGFVRAGAD